MCAVLRNEKKPVNAQKIPRHEVFFKLIPLFNIKASDECIKNVRKIFLVTTLSKMSYPNLPSHFAPGLPYFGL